MSKHAKMVTVVIDRIAYSVPWQSALDEIGRRITRARGQRSRHVKRPNALPGPKGYKPGLLGGGAATVGSLDDGD